MMRQEKIEARAPGKVILFGEHAINRGQPAIAAAVGVYARCCIEDCPNFTFVAGDRVDLVEGEEILRLAREVDAMRSAKDYEQIRALARKDYFAPQKYILAKFFNGRLPEGLKCVWESEIPSSSGLGSGGAAFTAMITALSRRIDPEPSLAPRAEWAQLGDIVAHGGIASGLDTQTSLLGGVIRYTGRGMAERIRCAAGACLIVANSGELAATSEVNSRVRLWLAEKPDSRMKYFETVGALSRAAATLLDKGDWDELGRLMNLNQLVLEKIGVSTSIIERLIEGALKSGAFGAKISGSGGGGIIIVLAPLEKKETIVQALRSEGAIVMTPEFGVGGAEFLSCREENALTGAI